MRRKAPLLLSLLLEMVVSSVILFAQQPRTTVRGAAPSGPRYSSRGPGLVPPRSSGGTFSVPFVNFYFDPSFGGYGSYFSPFFNYPLLPSPYPYMPNYWWVSPYPIADPRQSGYNPSAGYEWGDVTTLLLVTFPAKTRITLDGIFIGTSDYLGPFQLPVGEHTLRVEAAGYEPSETVLKIEQPVLQQLEVRLSPAVARAKPAPRP